MPGGCYYFVISQASFTISEPINVSGRGDNFIAPSFAANVNEMVEFERIIPLW